MLCIVVPKLCLGPGLCPGVKFCTQNQGPFGSYTNRGPRTWGFIYKLKIKETYNEKKLLVGTLKINQESKSGYSETSIVEEIFITKDYKEGPTIDLIKNEDIINDLINKFDPYQLLLHLTGFFVDEAI